MKLEQLIAKALRDKPENLTDETSRGNHKRWDSFSHVQIMVALEETLGVTFTEDEFEAMQSVGAIRRALTAKGVET